MKPLLPLLLLALVSCDDDKTVASPETAKEPAKSAPAGETPTPSPEAASTTKSSRPREITPPSKRLLTGKWHPETAGHVISPYTDESLLAIGVISGGKMTDSEGNEFIVPNFGESPITKYPIGKPIPGRPGFLFNPFTNKAVDARGIPGGTLLRDPNDPEPEHKFRTPPAE